MLSSELSPSVKANELTFTLTLHNTFATVHVLRAIYKERGRLNAAGKAIKNKKEVLKLPEVVWLPQEIAILHCKGHQKGDDPTAWGSHLANEAALAAACKDTDRTPSYTMALMPPVKTLPPSYTGEERKWAAAEGLP